MQTLGPVEPRRLPQTRAPVQSASVVHPATQTPVMQIPSGHCVLLTHRFTAGSSGGVLGVPHTPSMHCWPPVQSPLSVHSTVHPPLTQVCPPGQFAAVTQPVTHAPFTQTWPLAHWPLPVQVEVHRALIHICPPAQLAFVTHEPLDAPHRLRHLRRFRAVFFFLHFLRQFLASASSAPKRPAPASPRAVAAPPIRRRLSSVRRLEPSFASDVARASKRSCSTAAPLLWPAPPSALKAA